jgi:hypothetical protein
MLKGSITRYDDQLDEDFVYVEDVPAFQADTHDEIELWRVSIITWPEKNLHCVAIGECNEPIEKHAIISDWSDSHETTRIIAIAVSESFVSVCTKAFWKARETPGIVFAYTGARVPCLLGG